MDVTVKDTTAYRIIRLITDHVWGDDEKLSGSDCIAICRQFYGQGGSWERLMGGDMGDVKTLEDCIEGFVKGRRNSAVAARVARRPVRQ